MAAAAAAAAAATTVAPPSNNNNNNMNIDRRLPHHLLVGESLNECMRNKPFLSLAMSEERCDRLIGQLTTRLQAVNMLGSISNQTVSSHSRFGVPELNPPGDPMNRQLPSKLVNELYSTNSTLRDEALTAIAATNLDLRSNIGGDINGYSKEESNDINPNDTTTESESDN
jgi:hypothetical protein